MIYIKGLEKFRDEDFYKFHSRLEKEVPELDSIFLKMLCDKDIFHHGTGTQSHVGATTSYGYSCWNCKKELSFTVVIGGKE